MKRKVTSGFKKIYITMETVRTGKPNYDKCAVSLMTVRLFQNKTLLSVDDAPIDRVGQR